MKKELLIGCGNKLGKRLKLSQEGDNDWSNLTTLDHDRDCNPNVIWDLNECPYPFPDNEFDEVHAYEVLEHLGRQGDYKSFFAQFSEIWRILKPGGYLLATVPSPSSEWVWGDPGHTRKISPGSLVFLSQRQYREQIGYTPMTDYRSVYKADFDLHSCGEISETFWFILRAEKGGSA